jgi:hypothetical protein
VPGQQPPDTRAASLPAGAAKLIEGALVLQIADAVLGGLEE